MPKYRKKPVVVEAITFDEFVEYGKNNGGNIVDGTPWSFEYNGHPVTHENDELYLIPTLEGVHNFTPQDMLITGVNGEIYPCKKDIFEKTYEPADESDDTRIIHSVMRAYGFSLEQAQKLLSNNETRNIILANLYSKNDKEAKVVSAISNLNVTVNFDNVESDVSKIVEKISCSLQKEMTNLR